MKILVACEFSGTVRNAFAALGHDAWSCDLRKTSIPGNHYQGDVFEIIGDGWDLMIAHPPCTYLTVSGNRHFPGNPERWQQRLDAINFVWKLMQAPIPRIAIENPMGAISTHIRPPEQYIEPYMFGHPETKRTGLWLKNLPHLIPTKIVEPQYKVSKSGKRFSPTHWNTASTNNPANERIRSKTYQGIANAMAIQWGGYLSAPAQLPPITETIQANLFQE